MSCLHIDQIYLYLERLLPPSEIKKLKEHLDSCLKCREAVEERKLLLQASKTLPLLETPPYFTSEVMARIFPPKNTLAVWLTTVAVSFLSIVLAFALYFILTGENSINLAIRLGDFLLDALRGTSVFFIKIAKLIILLGKITFQFINFLTSIFFHLTKIITPEGQIILAVLSLILFISLFWGVKKKLITGVKA